MNERIRELAEQANELDYETFDEYNHKTVKHYKFNKEKFAELIVRECVSVGIRAFCSDHSVVPVFPAEKIKQHFGVEE
jgi:hypothetical protein